MFFAFFHIHSKLDHEFRIMIYCTRVWLQTSEFCRNVFLRKFREKQQYANLSNTPYARYIQKKTENSSGPRRVKRFDENIPLRCLGKPPPSPRGRWNYFYFSSKRIQQNSRRLLYEHQSNIIFRKNIENYIEIKFWKFSEKIVSIPTVSSKYYRTIIIYNINNTMSIMCLTCLYVSVYILHIIQH